MSNVHENFNNSRKKKINFRVELQSRELNLVLRKTAVRISKFLRKILKGMSNIVLQLMFSIDGDYNNLRNSKILCCSQVNKAVN